MHIAIVYLSGGGLSGGARNTLRAIVPVLRGDPRVERLDLFVPPRATSIPEVASLTPDTWPVRDRWFGFPALRRELQTRRPDVVFIPTAARLDIGNIPLVCMVRNMEAVLHPFGDNPWRVGIKNILRARIAKTACRKSTRIIAVSNFVRDFLVDRWAIPTAKIGVVYHGVSAPMPDEKTRPPETLSCLNAPFWFAAGSLIPYRGYEDVIRALAARVKSGGDERLVLAGQSVYSDDYQNKMEFLARQLGIDDRVRWLGYVDAARMAWCFRHALGFVMTSRLEACPNLVLEAMANGAVSISTTHPPMPEMYGPTAAFYPAGDVDALTRAMEQTAAMSPEDRTTARATARSRAETFSWSIAAGRTIEQLQLAMG